MKVGFLMDVVSYLHYLPIPHQNHIKVVCYFIRVHRPLRFIWMTDRDKMNSSLLVTTLKYIYYTFLLRTLCAYFWMYLVGIKFRFDRPHINAQRRMMQLVSSALTQIDNQDEQPVQFEMLYAMYIVNKIFIPIGPPDLVLNDADRIVFLMVMVTGTLMVTGAAVAALSSVISVHMRPEENFRTRYKIIMRDLVRFNLLFLMVMVTGTLMVTGAAVAALSSVISVHMRPEENFRTRYKIIMRDLVQFNLLFLMVMVTGTLMVTGAAVATLSSVISVHMRPEESFRTRYKIIMRDLVRFNLLFLMVMVTGTLMVTGAAVAALSSVISVHMRPEESFPTRYKIIMRDLVRHPDGDGAAVVALSSVISVHMRPEESFRTRYKIIIRDLVRFNLLFLMVMVTGTPMVTGAAVAALSSVIRVHMRPEENFRTRYKIFMRDLVRVNLLFLMVIVTGTLMVTGAAVAALSSVISVHMRPEESFRTRYKIIMRDLVRFNLLFLMVMVTGTLMVTGAAVAALSPVISVHMRPEESFRTRYKIIMRDLVRHPDGDGGGGGRALLRHQRPHAPRGELPQRYKIIMRDLVRLNLLFLMVMVTGTLMVTGAAVAALSSVISVHMRPEESFRTRYKIIMRDLVRFNLLFLMVMVTGTLMVTGAAVATLSSVISVHMRPEESFRTRYKIIMRDLVRFNLLFLMVMVTGTLMVTGAAVAALSSVISVHMRPEESFPTRYKIIMRDLVRFSLLFLMVMVTGTLMVTGAAVAALSPVISVHMRPEESFRTRYKIIMRDLTSSGIPESLRNKVETFYKMYWHKQRAVSDSQLLPSFPPVLPSSVYTDIYFEATQKSGLLRDLSYEFLSELARHMETIFYIPGDCIIKRNSLKNSIIYITLGDIEVSAIMLTAEDDVSPMLRFTRGTILTPWGGCAAGGGRAHVQMRAGTFCAARVLRARGLWRAALRLRGSGQARLMLNELRGVTRVTQLFFSLHSRRNISAYKSSILEFKNSLIALKEARDEDGELLLARPDYLLEIAGCYLMRNRADATLTDDSDPICLRQTFPCILQPTSSLLTAWNWFMACLILTVCFIYPYHIIFKLSVSSEFRFFDMMVTAIYVLDIITYLSTGTNVEEGVPITFMETASKQVRSPWFLVDVVATAPIFSFMWEGELWGINKILRFPKVIRMIQTLEEECVDHTNVIRFFVCALLLFFACYCLASVQQCVLCDGYGFCQVNNFTHEPFYTEAPLDDEYKNILNRLFFSLYWAMSILTFTCHIEMVQGNSALNMYTTILLEICIVMSISIEAVYSATIMVTTAFRESFDSCIADARNFLIRHQVPLQLRQRFLEHLQLCWDTRKAYSMTSKQSSVFYDLPPHVYQDILARQRSKFMLCIPFMKLLNNEDLKNVSSNARIFYCAPNEILLNTGDISTEMFIIKKGFCEVLNPDTKEVVGTLITKSHFGVLECIFRFPAFYTVRTTTHVLVFAISRKYLLQALEVPQIKDAINFAKEQEEYNRLLIPREPFSAYQPPPPVPNRERFKLRRKHEKDSAFLQPFRKFGFFSILRNVFPRFTFRPDSTLLTRYEVCRSFCAVAGTFVFPCYTYMVLQFPALYYVAIILDLSAYGDVIFRLFVGFFDEKGILVYHPANTAAHYLRGAFMLDLLGCLPLEDLEVSMKYSYGDLYQVTAMKQVLMLNRLLQLYRLPGTLDMLTSFVERRDIIIVFKTIPIFLTILNVLTVCLIFSSVRIYHSEDDTRWAFVPFNDPGGSWIHLYNNAYRFNVTESPFNLHVGCYFWIVSEATTTGYNTIAPSNLHIMSVLFWSMVLGSLTTIYMSVRIISLRANVDMTLATYQEHMRDLLEFMRRESLDKQLQKEIMDHYEFNWIKTDSIDARNVLKLCDQITLRSDAIMHLYGAAFAKCPILSDCDVSLLRVLGRAVRSIHFLEGTTIFQEDDVTHHLYFVYSGQLQLRTTDSAERVCKVTKLDVGSLQVIRMLTYLHAGSMAGNLSDAVSWRVRSRLVAATDVQLLRMRSKAFHDIVRDCFPVVLRLMATHRQDNELCIKANAASGFRRSSKPQDTTFIKHLAIKSMIQSGIVQVFLMITSMLCVYMNLYNAGFQNNTVPVLAPLYTLDACFLVKIVLYFTMPRLVKLPTEDHENAKMTYFKSMEFKIDVASFLPIELFCLLKSDPWLLLSCLRLNRVLRLSTVSKYLKRYQKRATENLLFSTLTLIMWFTILIHCLTCLWFFIGLSVDRAEPGQSWQYSDSGDPLCDNKYICSVYFVLTSFAHSGVADIMPKKEIEVVYVSALLIISQLMYVVYVGEFANIVHYASFRAFTYYAKFLELQDYLKNNRVSPALIALVNKYAVLLWREARGEQLPKFLANAPVCLKLKVMCQAYKDVGDQHPVFKSCEPALLRHMVGYLRQYYYDGNMYVVKQGEITNSMYLVHSGEVQEISENYDDYEDEGVKRRIFTKGEYFGIEQGLIRDKPYDYSYRTTSKSQVLTLLLDDWEYLLQHFPDSKKRIDDYRSSHHSKDDGPPPPPPQASAGTLGTPGGSETALEDRGPDDGPSGGPDVPPGTPPDMKPGEPDDPTSKTAPLIELKRTIYKYPESKEPEPELAVTDGLEGTSKGKSKTVKLKDETKASSFSRDPSEGIGERRKSALKISVKPSRTETSVKFHEEPLPASSSTQLFERIRNAARAVDDRLASRSIRSNDDTPSTELIKESKAVATYHSVEEYLAYKYKMRDSYQYRPKIEDEDQIDSDVRMSPSRRMRVKYPNQTQSSIHDGSDREHFVHSQLAESMYRVHSVESRSAPVLDLERPLGDYTPSNLSVIGLPTAAAPDVDIEPRKSSSTVAREDSQVPMTSKQAMQQSDAVEPKNADTDPSDDRGSREPKKQQIDAHLTRTPSTTNLLALPAPSDSLLMQQPSTIPEEFLNIAKPETSRDNDAARTASAEGSVTVPKLLALPPAPSSELPTPAMDTLTAIDALPEIVQPAEIVTERELSITSMRILQAETPTPIVAPPKDQATDLAALTEAEMLLDSTAPKLLALPPEPSSELPTPAIDTLTAIDALPEIVQPAEIVTERKPSITSMRILEAETSTPIVAPPQDQATDLAALTEAEMLLDSAAPKLLALPPAPSSELPTPAIDTLTAIDALPEIVQPAEIVTDREPSITSMRLLQAETPTPIVAPPKDQATDLATLTEAEMLLDSAAPTTKNTESDEGLNIPKEKQADGSVESESERQKTDAHKSEDQNNSGEEKTDQDKATDHNYKERKDKKD
ncbi:uncharacterized protein LOC134801742 [Cydia splendana]|uniref:uncharacterized protein LOC134801742 n=1 Tax=Cydia splendana TaxID=1100963 RepID=UPI00300DACB5